MENGVVVDLKGVEKSFGEEKVLQGLDLQVRAGETLVVIGKSGSGKSVTIRHIVGTRSRTPARCSSSARTRRSKRERTDPSRMVPLPVRRTNRMTAAENVELFLSRRKPRRREKKARHRKASARRDGERRGRAHGDSGGMKKSPRPAVILDPEIILYDELTRADPVIASTIGEIIIRTAKTLGSTQIVVTHDMESANKIADRIAMLYQGKIIAVGTPEEIKKSKDPIVHQFITGATQGPLSGENHA